MTYEVYHYISIGAAIACGLMIAVSVLLFFLLKIPRVISDLTGRTARRAIEDIRNRNESTGSKHHRPSSVNLRRGKVTDKISKSGRIQHPPAPIQTGGNATTKIPTQNLRGRSRKMPSQQLPGRSGQLPAQPDYAPRQVFQGEATTILPDVNATTVLPENNTTTVLPENNTTTVLPENNTTTVLPENNMTTVLPENNTAASPAESNVTTVLPENQAQPAAPAAQETTILAGTNETTVLYAGSETSVLYAPQHQMTLNPAAVFSVEREITFIHTSEVIPTETVYGR